MILSKELFPFLKDEQVIVNNSDLEIISKSTLPDQTKPNLIIFPESTQEVQKIVQISNQYKIPLWYVSTGKNWGYGCKSAPYQGGITLILERMKKIIEVNEELGYAVIEPGVTYSELHTYLEKTQSKLWTDSAGTTESASVIGNALDKGRGLTPYADHFGMLCGFDVVLANGELISTSPSKNFHCKHTYKWSLGPYMDGIFTQSNFGIVVKSGVWLMPKPEKFVFFAFEYQAGRDKFSSFINDFRELIFQNGLLSRPHLANDFAMLCIVDRYPWNRLKKNEKVLSEEALSEWKQQHGVPDWTFGGGLYGTSQQIQAQKKLVCRHLKPYGKVRFLGDTKSESTFGKLYRKLVMLGAKLEGKSDEFIAQIFPAINLFKGKPTDEFAKQVYFKSAKERPTGPFNPAQDDCGFIWTGPLVPFSSEHIQKALTISKEVFKQYEFDFFVELIVESPRTIIALFGVFFNPKDTEETNRARDWYKTIHSKMIEEGYVAYRETSTSTGSALDGNPQLKEMLSKIKKTLDENGTLAPGRYGIFCD